MTTLLCAEVTESQGRVNWIFFWRRWQGGDLNSGTDLCWKTEAEPANPSAMAPADISPCKEGGSSSSASAELLVPQSPAAGSSTPSAPGARAKGTSSEPWLSPEQPCLAQAQLWQYLAAVSSAAPTGTALPEAAHTAEGCSQGSRGEANWLSSPGPGGLRREKTERKAAFNVWVITELLLFIPLNAWTWAWMS